MPSILRSTVIEAPIDRVWSLMRDFGGWAAWHPAIAESAIEDGRPPDAIGCVRALVTADGYHARERLVAMSESEHSFSYELVEAAGSPMSFYGSTVRLRPVVDSGHTFVEWTGEFAAAPELEEKIARSVGRFTYEDGFAGIRAHLAAG